MNHLTWGKIKPIYSQYSNSNSAIFYPVVRLVSSLPRLFFKKWILNAVNIPHTNVSLVINHFLLSNFAFCHIHKFFFFGSEFFLRLHSQKWVYCVNDINDFDALFTYCQVTFPNVNSLQSHHYCLRIISTFASLLFFHPCHFDK